MSYSQAVATSCACTCQGNTYYPSPQCLSSEACLATCMTVMLSLVFEEKTFTRLNEKIIIIDLFLDVWRLYV